MSKAKAAVKEACKLPENLLAEHANSALQAKSIASIIESNIISFQYNDLNLIGALRCANSIDTSLRIEMMNLLEENMRSLYATSSMGWNRKEKQRELFDKASRFLIVTDSNSCLVAFLNWRFDCEECDEDDPQCRVGENILEVLYCYEVQIKAEYRSRHLGRLLMDMLQAIARHSRMKKIMLTVFLSNDQARRFYQKLGYSSDLISPVLVEEAESLSDYDIMSLAIST